MSPLPDSYYSRLHLHENRPLAGPRVRLRDLQRLARGDDVHPVALDARDRDAALLVVLVVCRGSLRGRAHAVLVVLAQQDDGDLPQRRHVRGLIQLPLVRGAVAVHRDAHGDAARLRPVLLRLVHVSEGDAHAHGDLRGR